MFDANGKSASWLPGVTQVCDSNERAMHCWACPQEHKLRGMKQRQREEVGKMAAFVFVLPEAAFTSQKQTLLSKSPRHRGHRGTLFICRNALAGQESVISDSWNGTDLRGWGLFALIHLIYHLLPTAAGEGERDTEQIRPAAQWNAADEVGHDAVCCSHRLETNCFQGLQSANCLQSLLKLWLQVVQ